MNSEKQYKQTILPWVEDWEKYPENEYIFQEGQYSCKIKRNWAKAYCGYITVPKGHPLENATWQSLDKINVHGGITFSENGTFGFDCIHAGDIAPGYISKFLTSKHGGHYWTFDEVKDQVLSLVKQFQKYETEKL